MMPKVIIHNCVSLDGAISGFDVDMDLYYGTAGSFGADIHLVGSRTAKAGMEMFMEKLPKESERDFRKPVIEPGDKRPYWAVPDSRGILKNKMHALRGSGFCKDVIVLVTPETPGSYIKYLKERNYDFITTGSRRVDLKKALGILYEKYKSRVILTDSGGRLPCVLLEKGLVDEISLLVAPVMPVRGPKKLFNALSAQPGGIKLELIKCEKMKNGYVLLRYNVL